MSTYMRCIAHAIDNRAALLSMACAEVCTLCGGVEAYVQDWRYMQGVSQSRKIVYKLTTSS